MNTLKSKVTNSLQFINDHRHLLPHAAKAIFNFRVDVITLSGRIRGGEEYVTLLYVGRKMNFLYLKKKYFADAKTVVSQKTNLFSFHRRMKSVENKADVIFIDIGWPYHGVINRNSEYLELPDWVNMVVPLDDDWDSIVKKFHRTTRKNDLRLIRRNEYRCELSNDADVIENFYHDYYLPFTKYRYADDLIFLSSLKEVQKTAQLGTILKVIGKDGPVSAGVIFPDDGLLCFPFTGMPSAFLEDPPEAAISALNYFCIRYAFDHSLTAVDLMGTRAFPTDGVLQFKRRWGAFLEDSFSPSSILFKPASNNLKAAIFSQQFPVIARRNGGLELVVCVLGQDFGDSELRRILSNYYSEGICQVTVVHLSDQNTVATSGVLNEHSNVRVISSNLEKFSQHYAREFRCNDDQQ